MWINNEDRAYIPLWFSLNTIESDAVILRESPFPYHYGSHSTCKKGKQNYQAQDVSIPLWFSLNWNVEFVVIVGCTKVSIPLWFSLNQRIQIITRSCLCFHTTMVLTQRGSDSMINSTNYSSFHTTMVLTQRRPRLLGVRTEFVSIPLWFLRNLVSR